MSNLYPIFIPTKNRIDAPFTNFCYENKLEVYLSIEPQDEKLYRDKFPNFKYLILSENNQGISYSRNQIIKYCRENHIKWFWMIDDDIEMVSEIVGKNSFNNDYIKNLKTIQSKALPINSPLFGVLCKLFCRDMSDYDHTFNSNFISVFLFNLDKLPATVNYDVKLRLYEDIDLLFQLHENKTNVCRFDNFCYSASKGIGKWSVGGMSEIYHSADRFKDCVDYFINKYPDIASLMTRKTDDFLRIKIHWNEARKKYNMPISHVKREGVMKPEKAIEKEPGTYDESAALINNLKNCLYSKIKIVNGVKTRTFDFDPEAKDHVIKAIAVGAAANEKSNKENIKELEEEIVKPEAKESSEEVIKPPKPKVIRPPKIDYKKDYVENETDIIKDYSDISKDDGVEERLDKDLKEKIDKAIELIESHN